MNVLEHECPDLAASRRRTTGTARGGAPARRGIGWRRGGASHADRVRDLPQPHAARFSPGRFRCLRGCRARAHMSRRRRFNPSHPIRCSSSCRRQIACSSTAAIHGFASRVKLGSAVPYLLAIIGIQKFTRRPLLPQIDRPALRGFSRNALLRSSMQRAIAVWASSLNARSSFATGTFAARVRRTQAEELPTR